MPTFGKKDEISDEYISWQSTSQRSIDKHCEQIQKAPLGPFVPGIGRLSNSVLEEFQEFAL
jgi:hypothetical protein